jgi:hypothetical protein
VQCKHVDMPDFVFALQPLSRLRSTHTTSRSITTSATVVFLCALAGRHTSASAERKADMLALLPFAGQQQHVKEQWVVEGLRCRQQLLPLMAATRSPLAAMAPVGCHRRHPAAVLRAGV